MLVLQTNKVAGLQQRIREGAVVQQRGRARAMISQRSRACASVRRHSRYRITVKQYCRSGSTIQHHGRVVYFSMPSLWYHFNGLRKHQSFLTSEMLLPNLKDFAC